MPLTDRTAMTNMIALFLGMAIAAAIGLDLLTNDGAALIFTARKFMDLLDWVVLWR
jgi:hypothetical protein